jgi:hypothetical protein
VQTNSKRSCRSRCKSRLSPSPTKKRRATADAIDAADSKLVDQTYPRTIQGVRVKLGEAIQYSHDDRPTVIELRAKALRTWTALLTKAKTTTARGAGAGHT